MDNQTKPIFVIKLPIAHLDDEKKQIAIYQVDKFAIINDIRKQYYVLYSIHGGNTYEVMYELYNSNNATSLDIDKLQEEILKFIKN